MGLQRTLDDIEVAKRQTRVEEYLLTGLQDDRAIALALGVVPAVIAQDRKAIMERWLGERPKRNKERRELIIRTLRNILRQAQVEYERSRLPTYQTTKEYLPRPCPKCDGTGMAKNRKRCTNCKGTGEVLKEKKTRKKIQQNGDPRYQMVAVTCAREIARLEGMATDKLRKKGEVAASQHLHLHVQGQIEKWKNAPPDLLLEAKVLADKMDAVLEPIQQPTRAKDDVKEAE